MKDRHTEKQSEREREREGGREGEGDKKKGGNKSEHLQFLNPVTLTIYRTEGRLGSLCATGMVGSSPRCNIFRRGDITGLQNKLNNSEALWLRQPIINTRVL